LRVLTTSRAPLGLSSESVYLLPELSLPTTVELFNQRARAARPGVDLPADVVQELCGHLDGLPLAVELAAARVRVLSVAEISRRLGDRFTLLRGGPRDAPQRHRTLHAVVDWSWNLLEPSGQAALRALSVFPDGFTAEAAAYLVGDADPLAVLEGLVDQSLLGVHETPSGARFRMLETVREFSIAHRDAAGESERAVDGFVAWARDFGIAHHEAPFGADPYPSAALIKAEQDNLLQALRHGLTRGDGATVAATSAVLAALWIIESDYARLMTLSETAWVLSHFRPEPDLVDTTRASSTLSLASAYMLVGSGAVRPLATLRRLPPARPDTVLRAAAVVLRAAREIQADPGVLAAMCNSDEPLLAGIANGIASYVLERENDLDGAQAAAECMVEAFDVHEFPWMRVMSHTRAGELCLQVEQGAEAERHLRAAHSLQEDLGAPLDVVGIRWAMVLASLQQGSVAEAERWLGPAMENRADQDPGTVTFGTGAQAEIALARGDVEAGLQLWRQAVEGLKDVEHPAPDGDPGLEPWALEVRAVAVTAHARHGRHELVEELSAELSHSLSRMLTDPVVKPPAYLMDLAVSGALLLALATTDLDRGARSGDTSVTVSGVRLTALAERFRFLRTFHPTMASAPARRAAEQADRSAYEQAVATYADLDRDGLRAAALALLRERDQT
jgi:hypothetical protein